MNDTQTATGTDDTLEVLGARAGNFRAAYWDAVDRADAAAFMPWKSDAELDALKEDTVRLLTSWREAESALEAYRAALNARSSSAPGVVFVPVEVYELSWTSVAA